MIEKPSGPADPMRAQLRQRIKDKGFTEKELSIALGANPAYLSQFITLQKPKVLPEKIRLYLLDVLGMGDHELGGAPFPVSSQIADPDAITYGGTSTDAALKYGVLMGVALIGGDDWARSVEAKATQKHQWLEIIVRERDTIAASARTDSEFVSRLAEALCAAVLANAPRHLIDRDFVPILAWSKSFARQIAQLAANRQRPAPQHDQTAGRAAETG